ncbi:MAG: MFS transporter [Syntrophobacteraceae bacterium]
MEKSDSLAEISSHTAFSSRHLVLFMLCAALFFCSMFHRSSNAVIALQLQQDLALTPETLGILSASFFYAFAVTQVPLALLLDRLGARLIMTVLTFAGSVGACLFAVADGFGLALAGRTLLGLGMAGNLMGGLKLFTRWFSPREFATLSGLLVGFGTLGNIAACTPLALLVDAIGWRAALGAAGILTALLAIFFHIVIQDSPHPEALSSAKCSGRPKNCGIGALFSSRDYWLISCGTFFRYGTLMAIQGLWAGPYLIEYLKLSPVQAGNLIMLTTVGYVAGCSGGGWLSDRVLASRKYVAVMGLAGMAAVNLCLTMAWGQSDVFMRGCTFFFLGLFPGFGNVMYAHIKGIMPVEMAGMALAGINFFTMLGVGAYIHLIGLVLEHLGAGGAATGAQGYQAAFSLALAGVVLATVLYLFTNESKEFK